eukprot:8282022-Pyramimonas_sp.AAC.1
MWLGFVGLEGPSRVSWSWCLTPRATPSKRSASQPLGVCAAARKGSLVPPFQCFPAVALQGCQ